MRMQSWKLRFRRWLRRCNLFSFAHCARVNMAVNWETTVQQQNGQAVQVLLHSKMQVQGDSSCRKRREQTCCMGIFSARELCTLVVET